MAKSKPWAEHQEESEAILKKACKVNRGVWSCHFFFKSLLPLSCTTEFKRSWEVFLGFRAFFFFLFFNLWRNNSCSCQAMRKRRQRKSCLNLLKVNKPDVTGSRVHLKTAKEWCVLVDQGWCKAGRKASSAILQRGIRCQCQWLLSNTHWPSQQGPSLPACPWCTHLTACGWSLLIYFLNYSREFFLLQKINLKETWNKYK